MNKQQRKLVMGLMERWNVIAEQELELFCKILTKERTPELVREHKKVRREEHYVIVALCKAIDEIFPTPKPDVKAELMSTQLSLDK